VTEREACWFEEIRELGPEPDFVLRDPLGLLIEGDVNEKWVAQCRRTGSFRTGEGYEAAELHCNAILKVAAGELEPTKICGPPHCSEPGTPIWFFSEAELRDLADADRT